MSCSYATAHIPQIIAMCERLIASGHAYVAEGHVLFSVASFADYGRLSRRDPEEMLAGARIDVAPYKRDAGDFVLWKPSDDTLPGWDSPWGRGRPGWHIECSAMAEAHLGDTIDIHGGGMDLQFPHHENEIAQSECAHGGHVFARYWMHSGMLNLGGSKMSKSLGNTFHVHDLLKAVPAEVLRYALLSGRYRQPLDWSDALIEQSIRTLDRLYGTLRDLSAYDRQSTSIRSTIPQSIDECAGRRPRYAKRAGRRSPWHCQARGILARTAGPIGRSRTCSDGELKAALLGAGRTLNLLQMDPTAWFSRGARRQRRCAHPGADRRNRNAAKAGTATFPRRAMRSAMASFATEGIVPRRHATQGVPLGEARFFFRGSFFIEAHFPLEPTASAAQAAIAEEFGYFSDWSERYQYLIDLGRQPGRCCPMS